MCAHIFPPEQRQGEWSLVGQHIKFTETVVPVCQISKPLVTAQDDEDNNKLWILNYREKQARYMEDITRWHEDMIYFEW